MDVTKLDRLVLVAISGEARVEEPTVWTTLNELSPTDVRDVGNVIMVDGEAFAACMKLLEPIVVSYVQGVRSNVSWLPL